MKDQLELTEKIIALKTNADSLQNPYDSDAKDDKDSLIKLVQKFTVKPYQKRLKKPKLDKLKKYSKKDITIKDILGHSIEKTFDQKITSNLEELLVETESISDFLSRRILEEKNKSEKSSNVNIETGLNTNFQELDQSVKECFENDPHKNRSQQPGLSFKCADPLEIASDQNCTSNLEVTVAESVSIIDLLDFEEKSKKNLSSKYNTDIAAINDFEQFDQGLSKALDRQPKRIDQIQTSGQGTRGLSVKYPELQKFSDLISSSSIIN